MEMDKKTIGSWLSLIENGEKVRHIYSDGRIPQMSDLELQSTLFTFGEDMEVELSFITKELPTVLPQRWIQNKVNAVHIIIDCIRTQINHFAPDGDMLNCSLSITEIDGVKQICVSNCHKEFIALDVQWVYIKSITGIHIHKEQS